LFESIIEHVVGLVDELVVGVKKVDFDVWFWRWNLVFKGG
jgi:hypothetical protein